MSGGMAFLRGLHLGALLVNAAAVAAVLLAVARAPAGGAVGDYAGFGVLVATIYSAPGLLALLVAVLLWRRPLVRFGPRLGLMLATSVWSLHVLFLHLSFFVASMREDAA